MYKALFRPRKNIVCLRLRTEIFLRVGGSEKYFILFQVAIKHNSMCTKGSVHYLKCLCTPFQDLVCKNSHNILQNCPILNQSDSVISRMSPKIKFWSENIWGRPLYAGIRKPETNMIFYLALCMSTTIST